MKENSRNCQSAKKNYHKPCYLHRECGHLGWKKVEEGRYYCKRHYRIIVLRETPKQYQPRGSQKGRKCSIASCLAERKAGGLCNSHYRKRQRNPEDWNKPLNRRRKGHVGLGYVSVRKETLQYYKDIAAARSVAVDDVATEVLEAYFKLKQAEQVVEPRIARDPWYRKESVFSEEVDSIV